MLLGQAFLGPGGTPCSRIRRSSCTGASPWRNGAPFAAVPLPGLDYDLDAMLAAVREDTSLLIICNPNNPTGSYLEPAVLRAFLSRVPSRHRRGARRGLWRVLSPRQHADRLHRLARPSSRTWSS